MNTDIITMILASALIISYGFYAWFKIKDAKEEEIKSDKIIAILKEYSKNHSDLANLMNKMGLL